MSPVDDICVFPRQIKAEYSIEELEKKLSEEGLVDVNNAGKDEIIKIPGVGPALAERIITFRENNGSFTGKQDILKVSGIGEKKFKIIKKYIKI